MTQLLNASGDQFDLVHGELAASIAEVGASLRTLTSAGRPLVLGYDAAEVRPDYRGAILAPWPNRIRAGAYEFGGVHHQLPITEPARGNAIHGLVAWRRWDVVERSGARTRLRHRIVPQPGFPHSVELSATYELVADGLKWSLAAANLGDSIAPYGCGPHPYLVAGSGVADDWTLTLPADAVLDGDDVRDVGNLDFRKGDRIGGRVLDATFTRLVADSDGLARARLVDPRTGDGVELAWDPAVCPWLQVYTYDFGAGSAYRAGVAVEPMTCPPYAFNSGRDVITLAPRAEHRAEWILRPLSG